MAKRITVDEYFQGAETLRPMELVHGIVREPPAPRYGHQSLVTRTTVLLDRHVRERGLGTVCVSPIDVVLDRDRALVVQPDIVFVSNDRSGIIHERIWGAPDLVVEVLSRRTAVRDQTEKLGWYRQYGVKECWFIDPLGRTVEIVDCRSTTPERRQVYAGPAVVVSDVLPTLDLPAEDFFN
jgi:Uma2 family endonuclease